MNDIETRLSKLEETVQDLTVLVKHIIDRNLIRVKEPKTELPKNRLQRFRTATGIYYLPTDAPYDGIANDIKDNKIFEQCVYETAVKYIKKDSIVLDIGSNFGQMAVLMARHVGADGMVYAFEANEFVFEILKRNVAENDARIKPHFCAVHKVSGETLFFPETDLKRFPTYGSYGIDYVNHQGRPVTSLAIDDLTFDRPISFMKIDVQGGDLFAMQGAVKTIEKYQMPILFEYEKEFEQEQGYNFQQYSDFIQSINYHIVEQVMEHNYLILPNKE